MSQAYENDAELVFSVSASQMSSQKHAERTSNVLDVNSSPKKDNNASVGQRFVSRSTVYVYPAYLSGFL